MIKGFRDFIMRGNVIDLAVAVVIGGAFTAVVNAIVASIINPLVALVWKADENGNAGFPVQGLHGEVIFPVGALLTAVISFFAVALVVYLVFVVPMNRWKERQAAKAGVVEQAAPLPTEQELLIQIRDLLEQNRAAAPAATAASATDGPLRRSQSTTPPATPSA
ncbi:large conductance mechanosensitive channel protein MscL [Microbacterium thalli]|uniref:Large-conductance mechanosensitive channel n=1 Tax=Microbacterium thalli TaxID=3027921 RepID=A0ABT5SJC6_9MICO|nr:large conductance mechanosensitive channel protein MscL [Microbacterium thalli]MDD7929382.1 large conductance mechanosensitive channel protein MscL [Microbacterium thalli]MDD7961968.1 large conductance mechanosensitive channel protein MscL [Microbacterium thalli]MDN8549924.1 large conductance mechanosensitive channel protein MscL [Microbacterium thalli]